MNAKQKQQEQKAKAKELEQTYKLDLANELLEYLLKCQRKEPPKQELIKPIRNYIG
jgi:hypothetical protein